MPGQARLDAPETLHHVMVRGIECGKIVEAEKDHIDFVKRMGGTAEKTENGFFWRLDKSSQRDNIVFQRNDQKPPRRGKAYGRYQIGHQG
jgi:hypothetical protein